VKHVLLAASLLFSAACGPALRTARRTAEEPPAERELEAAEAQARSGCSPIVSAMVPGVGQLCEGRTTEGALLLGLGAAEVATGVTVAVKHGDFTYPGAGVPLLAFSDLVLYQGFAMALEAQRARRLLYVPQDSTAELVAAPFNLRVLGEPDVLLGIVGTFAAGLGVSALTDGLTPLFRGKPRLFGTDFAPGLGYATGGAIGIGLFEHVALAEETTFRGYFQSGFARRSGEDRGWLYGSLLFGLMHAPNALFMEPSQRLRYLAVGVPFITALGSYLGLSYRWHGYGLAAPVAIHFWYDLLISATTFAMDPQHNQLAGSIAFPF
jgi:membrane protease YdiL (CAAX protease family)